MKRSLECALAAARWLGTREGSREHGELLEVYNAISPLPRGYRMRQADAWCAAFVSAAAVLAGAAERYPLECSCSKLVERAIAMKIWTEDDGHTPQIGDWVLYNWQASPGTEDTGAPDHVGIVIGVESGEILAVEGNYDNSVKLRRVPVGWDKIRGYVCPEREVEEMRYHTLEAVPEYAQTTIRKLVSDGSLRGISDDDLGLTEELVRMLVILDRRGIL